MRAAVRPGHDEKKPTLISVWNTGEIQAAYINLATSCCVFCSYALLLWCLGESANFGGIVVEGGEGVISGRTGECGILTIHNPVVKLPSPSRMILSFLYIFIINLCKNT